MEYLAIDYIEMRVHIFLIYDLELIIFLFVFFYHPLLIYPQTAIT